MTCLYDPSEGLCACELPQSAGESVVTSQAGTAAPAAELCSDCPPIGYPDKSRCAPCPRRKHAECIIESGRIATDDGPCPLCDDGPCAKPEFRGAEPSQEIKEWAASVPAPDASTDRRADIVYNSETKELTIREPAEQPRTEGTLAASGPDAVARAKHLLRFYEPHELEDAIASAIAAAEKRGEERGHSRTKALFDDALLAIGLSREKLAFYRKAHGGEYVGGMEFTALDKKLDETAASLREFTRGKPDEGGG